MLRVLDPGDVCRLLFGLETAGKRHVDRFPIGIDCQRNPRTLRRLGCDHVHVGGHRVHLGDRAAQHDVRHADPGCIAFRILCKVTDDHALDARFDGLFRRATCPDDVAVDHVRVRAISGDVLADAVDDQHVDPLAGQASHTLAGDFEQFLFALPDTGRGYRLSLGQVPVAILDHRHPKGDVDLGKRELGDRGNQMVELIHTLGMEELGAFLFAKPDGDHLHQARFDRSPEIGMRLHPADWNHRVRLERIAIEPDRNVSFDLAEMDRIHAGEEWTTHRLFRDAVVRYQLQLAFGGRPTVTPHRRYDTRLGAELAHFIDDSPHDLVDPVDTATPGRDRDTLPGAEAITDTGPVELGRNRGPDVANERRIQKLTYRRPARELPALEDLESHGIPLTRRQDGKTARR